MDTESTNVVVLDQDDLKSLDTVYSLYTKEQKIEAVTLFCQGYSLNEISRALDIPPTTMKNWRERSTWWDDIALKNKKDKQVELDNKLTETIHKTIDQLNDRLNNGDEKQSRSGELQRVPLSGRDLASILATLYEKRALIRGEATSIKTESTTTLQSLEDKFKSFALQLKEKDIVATQS